MKFQWKEEKNEFYKACYCSVFNYLAEIEKTGNDYCLVIRTKDSKGYLNKQCFSSKIEAKKEAETILSNWIKIKWYQDSPMVIHCILETFSGTIVENCGKYIATVYGKREDDGLPFEVAVNYKLSSEQKAKKWMEQIIYKKLKEKYKPKKTNPVLISFGKSIGKHKIIRVTMTADYLVPMFDDKTTTLDGRTIQEVKREWFHTYGINEIHVSRDNHLIGGSKKISKIEVMRGK